MALELLDDIILEAYSNISKPTRNYLTKVIKEGPPVPGQEKEDGDSVDVVVHVRGNLKRIESVLRPEITILSAEMSYPSPKRFVKLFQTIREKSPDLKVLKMGYSVANPMRLDPKNEKKFCKAITALANDCTKLKHFDIRDIVITRPMYNVLCDLYQLKSISATLVWDDIAPMENDTVCKDKLVYKIDYLRTIDLMCFKTFCRRYRGPTVPEMKSLTEPRVGMMRGVSALVDTEDFNWLFRCHRLRYLDLEVTNDTLLKPSAAVHWEKFKKLVFVKIVGSGKAKGVPPIRKVDSITHLLLDVKIPEPDWNKWYRSLPDSLEWAAFFGVNRLQRDMWEIVTETTPVLKSLYVGYREDNPDSMLCPSKSPPFALRHVLILKDNDIETKHNHHAIGALYMKRKFDKMIFKLDSFERPRNSRMPVVWKDFVRRLHWMRTRQVILDWRIHPLRDALFEFIDCNDVTPDMKKEESEGSEDEDSISEAGEEGDTDDSDISD